MNILTLSLLFALSAHCVEPVTPVKKGGLVRSPAMIWQDNPADAQPIERQEAEVVLHEHEPVTPPRAKRRKKELAARDLHIVVDRVHVPRKRRYPRVTPSPSPVEEVIPMNILEGYEESPSSDDGPYGSSLMISRMNSDLARSNHLLWSHYYISEECRKKWAAERDKE